MTTAVLLDLSPSRAISAATALADTSDRDREPDPIDLTPPPGFPVGAGPNRTYPRKES